MKKGEYKGRCNLSSCPNILEPATWYNHGSRAYYCRGCAARLNTDQYNQRDAMRLFGHNLCNEGENKPNEVINNNPSATP